MDSVSSSLAVNPLGARAVRLPWPHVSACQVETESPRPPTVFDRVDPQTNPIDPQKAIEEAIAAAQQPAPLAAPPCQRTVLGGLLVSVGVVLSMVPGPTVLAAQPPAISESVRVADVNGSRTVGLLKAVGATAIDLKALEAEERFSEVAKHAPDHMVTLDGFRMTAETAARFQILLEKVGKSFPSRIVRITSTTGGRHADPDHRLGRAVDFVVQPLSKKESKVLERLAEDAGFHPFNEYLRNSRFKTGRHMHVSLD